MATTACQTQATVLSMRVNLMREARREDTPNVALSEIGREAA
jgi:hypothetical protein